MLPFAAASTASFARNQLSGTLPAGVAALLPANSSTWSSTCVSGASNWYTGCALTERAALVDLFVSTLGYQWANASGWLSQTSSPCPSGQWFGVFCGGATGPVTGLVLVSNQLSGTLPSTLSAFTSLTYLDVFANGGLGGTLPPVLLSLTGLATLRVEGVAVSGTIPSSIGALKALVFLSLSSCQLGGERVT